MKMEEFKFPITGWEKDGSFSYGADILYRSIPKVAVRIFNDDEKELAEKTHAYLKGIKIKSAYIKCIRHVDDNRDYYYVFAKRDEFLSKLESQSINIILEEKKRNT